MSDGFYMGGDRCSRMKYEYYPLLLLLSTRVTFTFSLGQQYMYSQFVFDRLTYFQVLKVSMDRLSTQID